MYSHDKQFIKAGKGAMEAEKAIILLHGRGATAHDIILLQRHLHLADMAIYAPQASNNSWYPHSFMAPVRQNQPALDSALDVIDTLVTELKSAGIPAKNLYLGGFSQGACLSLEYVARHASRFGGVIAFTGGLIGEQLEKERYRGDFAGTPVLITTGSADPHVPLNRVEESVVILKALGADVQLKIYPGKPHSISPDEINLANNLIL